MSKASELANLIGNINMGGGGVNRNVIINGAMNVSQRGTQTNPSSNAYNLDRYAVQWAGISPQLTISQDTSVPSGEGFSKSMKILTSNTQTPSAGQGAFMYQKVEGSNVYNCHFGTANAKTMTLSFWVKSSKTGTYSVAFINNGFDRTLLKEYSISSADTWEKKTITFTGDTSGTWVTDNTIGLAVYFNLSNGDGSSTSSTINSWQAGNYYLGSQNQVNLWDASGATWYITGIQVEIGQNATEFESEPFERTLAKCQRYYFVLAEGDDEPILDGGMYNSTIFLGGVTFPVTMRTSPTLDEVEGTNYFNIIMNGGNDLADGIGINRDGNTHCAIEVSGNASGTAGHSAQVRTGNASAKVRFKAEL